MHQPFEVTQDGKVAIVGAKIEKNRADRWRVIIKKCERSGRLYAAGIGMIRSSE